MNGITLTEAYEAAEHERARQQTGNYLDAETTKIMCDLSTSLWQVKHKWRKILRNGMEVVNDRVPSVQVKFKINGQGPYEKTLREYKQRYFTLNELMQYMVDQIKKNEETAKSFKKDEAAPNVAAK